jgi:hypothetical protein
MLWLFAQNILVEMSSSPFPQGFVTSYGFERVVNKLRDSSALRDPLQLTFPAVPVAIERIVPHWVVS